MPKPNFFIVGAPKCGTTAMYEYLRVHPKIYMPEVKKEPHFFDQEFQPWRSTSPQTMENYLKLFEGAGDAKRIGEASVYYLYSEVAAQNIHDFDPDAKIIIMLRNPVEMVYSLYHQEYYSGNETLTSFEQALDAEEDRKAGKRVPARATQKKLYYRQVASYTQQVKRYFETFGRENVHVIIFDDLKSDTARVYREALTFLDVDRDFVPEFRIVNANKMPRFHSVNRLFMKPPRWYVLLKSVPRRMVSDETRRRINKMLSKANTRVEKRPPLRLETRQYLQEYFQPEIDALSELLGRDLSHWYAAKEPHAS